MRFFGSSVEKKNSDKGIERETVESDDSDGIACQASHFSPDSYISESSEVPDLLIRSHVNLSQGYMSCDGH